MTWHIRAFCKCGFDAGQHLNGDLWFATTQIPVCPKCGDRSTKSFTNKIVRWVRTGWFGKGHYEERQVQP